MLSAATPALAGEGWRQVGELGLALLLSALIGFEREIRQKSAGLRTHVLVGVGAGLFMLVSKYGFNDVLQSDRIVLDPSRVAAQIVSGIGFLGAGIIFVRRDSVHGLTTAAAIWVTAAIGMAAAAGLPVLASVTTGVYLVVTVFFPLVMRKIPSWSATSVVRVRYPDGRGLLRELLQEATSLGFAVEQVSAETVGTGEHRTVQAVLHVRGKASVDALAAALSDIADVEAVAIAGDAGYE